MKKYKIKFLPAASIDRDDIKAYLAQYYKSTVKNFFTQLMEKTNRLKDFPYSCPAYEGDPDYRQLTVGEYLVFYMVNEDTKTIEIHRILHSSQDLKRQLKSD